MLVQRRRRWPSFKAALDTDLVVGGCPTYTPPPPPPPCWTNSFSDLRFLDIFIPDLRVSEITLSLQLYVDPQIDRIL